MRTISPAGTVKHFHEQLTKRHNYTLGNTVTKSHLHRAGLVRPAPKRSLHRKLPRRPMRGMMLHRDGSRHAWIEGQPAMDLIVTMDDAMNELAAARAVGPLRARVEAECEAAGCAWRAVTVLSNEVDLYRQDMESGHLDGRWLAAMVARLIGPVPKIHLCGVPMRSSRPAMA